MIVGDIINLNITDFDSEGMGIGHYDMKPVFVDNALIGENVRCRITRVTKNLAFAENIEILEESNNREHNICPYLLFFRNEDKLYLHPYGLLRPDALILLQEA